MTAIGGALFEEVRHRCAAGVGERGSTASRKSAVGVTAPWLNASLWTKVERRLFPTLERM